MSPWYTQGDKPRVTENPWESPWLPQDGKTPCTDLDDGDREDRGDGTVKLSDLLRREEELTDDPELQAALQAMQVLEDSVIDAIEPGATSNPANVRRVESILDEEAWEQWFELRAPEYTDRGFLQGVGKFPAFCSDTTGADADPICRKALATMLAHFVQETGGHDPSLAIPEWRQGLVYLREIGWDEDSANGYGDCNAQSSVWGEAYPCGVFAEGHPSAGEYKSYFGRGAKQLSYNFNYGPFSRFVLGDVGPLLESPEWVAEYMA
jgi:chitodextrinase